MMFEHILCVCHGNICRSPMAMGLFSHSLSKRFPNLHVTSAGIKAMVDYPAEILAQEILKQYDIDISKHRARQVTKPIVMESELILVMETNQKQYLELEFPSARGRIFLLGHWLGEEIPDPYQASLNTYHYIFSLIKDGVGSWMAKI